MCAESTTYSFFSAGSVPGSLATTLSESTSFTMTFACALMPAVRGKRGNWLAVFRQSGDLVEGVARTLEQLFRGSRIEHDRKLDAR